VLEIGVDGADLGEDLLGLGLLGSDGGRGGCTGGEEGGRREGDQKGKEKRMSRSRSDMNRLVRDRRKRKLGVAPPS
jgi:hypothetical protein